MTKKLKEYGFGPWLQFTATKNRMSSQYSLHNGTYGYVLKTSACRVIGPAKNRVSWPDITSSAGSAEQLGPAIKKRTAVVICKCYVTINRRAVIGAPGWTREPMVWSCAAADNNLLYGVGFRWFDHGSGEPERPKNHGGLMYLRTKITVVTLETGLCIVLKKYVMIHHENPFEY